MFLNKKSKGIDPFDNIKTIEINIDGDSAQTLIYTLYSSFGVTEDYDFVMNYIKKTNDEFIYLTPFNIFGSTYRYLAIRAKDIIAVKGSMVKEDMETI
jgi:hypothetical protein